MGDDQSVAWLRRCVETRLTAARQACHKSDGHWWRGKDAHGPRGDLYDGAPALGEEEAAWVLGGEDVVVYDEGVPSSSQFEHISLNDPRDVIARCESELTILGLCTDTAAMVDREKPRPPMSSILNRRELAVLTAVLEEVARAYRHWPGWAEHWSNGPRWH